MVINSYFRESHCMFSCRIDFNLVISKKETKREVSEKLKCAYNIRVQSQPSTCKTVRGIYKSLKLFLFFSPGNSPDSRLSFAGFTRKSFIFSFFAEFLQLNPFKSWRVGFQEIIFFGFVSIAGKNLIEMHL